MKFRNIAEIIKSVDLENILLKSKGNYTYYYSNESKENLKKILQIPSINKKYGAFLKNILLVSPYEEYIENQSTNSANAMLEEIRLACLFFIENFEEIYPKINENSISIKFPETESLQELGNYYIKIDKAINNIIVNNKINGNLKFVNSDVGSIWVDVTLGASAAVYLLGNIINSAYVIKNQKVKQSLLEIEYEKANIQKEQLKVIEECNAKIIKAYTEKEVEYIMNSNFSDMNDPELKNRVKKTVIEFSEFIEKGMEVHPAIDAAEKIKIEYPDFKNPLSIVSKIKEITNKKGE